MLFIFKGYLWLCLWDRFSFIVITVKVKKDAHPVAYIGHRSHGSETGISAWQRSKRDFNQV